MFMWCVSCYKVSALQVVFMQVRTMYMCFNTCIIIIHVPEGNGMYFTVTEPGCIVITRGCSKEHVLRVPLRDPCS